MVTVAGLAVLNITAGLLGLCATAVIMEQG